MDFEKSDFQYPYLYCKGIAHNSHCYDIFVDGVINGFIYFYDDINYGLAYLVC